MEAVQMYALQRIGDHLYAEIHEAIGMYQAARLLNFTYVKQHELSTADIELLDRDFRSLTQMPLRHVWERRMSTAS